ncbi:MAG: hypothetical protein KDD34_04340 [Bdellovibrionales bacterium]|nr:hypothetical protein [Bdellovibrionales bacterium]
MKLIISILAVFSIQAFAFDSVGPQLNFPNDSEWAIGMISIACNVKFTKKEGVVGTIEKANGGVVYRAYYNGEEVLAAKAKNTSIFAKKTCLN